MKILALVIPCLNAGKRSERFSNVLKLFMSGKYKISELIPQRDPIIMVDKITHSDDNLTVTSFKIREDNIFCSQGFLQESGLIENIAQTAAARAGYIRKEKELETIVGYIGGIKNLRINALPEDDAEIVTTVKVTNTVFNVTIVKGEVRNKNGFVFAECEMKIFLNQ